MSVKRTNTYSGLNYYFANFDGRSDFIEQGEKALVDLPFGSYAKSMYKNGIKRLNLIDFKEKSTLNRIIDEFENLFANIDMGGAFKKSKLIITDDKRGIFDFSLASKGLIRVQEYYSEKLAVDSPLEFPTLLPGLVPPELVVKDRFDNYWYTSSNNNEQYLMLKQQKGTRAIELKIPGAKLQFSTTTKKSYVMFERKGGKAKMVDLYIVAGGNADLNSTGMLARSMPMLLAAKYFESIGIRARIVVARAFMSGSQNFCFTYPIKDYGEEVDFNWIALNVADTRWFQGDLFAYLSLIADNKMNIKTPGYGTALYTGDRLFEVFNRYKNWYFEEMHKGNLPELRVNKNLMLIGGLSSPNNNINGQKNSIVQEFYRILDTVDFQFNDPKKAAERIYKRMVEENKLSTTSFKYYVLNVLAEAYSFPETGPYATKPEEQDKMVLEYEKAEQGLFDYLESLK